MPCVSTMRKTFLETWWTRHGSVSLPSTRTPLDMLARNTSVMGRSTVTMYSFSGARAEDRIHYVTVIGQQYEAVGILVQPAYGKDALRVAA